MEVKQFYEYGKLFLHLDVMVKLEAWKHRTRIFQDLIWQN